MHIHIHPYAIFSIFSALISFVASLRAWRRSAPGSLMLSLLLLSMTIWSGFYSTRWMDISLPAKAIGFNLMFIGVASLPTLFLLFVLAFTHNNIWLTRRNLFLLSIHPVSLVLLEWTNSYHHLLYLSLKAVEVNNFMAMEYIRGPLYFVSVIYSYVIIGIALFILGQGALHLGPLYQNQYRLIIIASILPWAGNIYSENYFDVLHGLDLAPITFGLSGIIFASSVLRANFMDLIPIARSHLIENMRDGILVLDAQNRIVDINPAMENFIEKKASFYMGKNAFEVFEPWMEKTDLLLDGLETRTELRIPKDPSRYLDYPLCVIMIDLDHFKRVNDTHGHEAGDEVLKALAFTLFEQCRRGDFACRFGGEEFVVVMPNINMDTAYERAENIRQSLNSLRVPYGQYNLTITISMGIACYPINGETRESVLRAADQAMYGAKEAGRDHILSYDEFQVLQEAMED